MVLAAGCAGTHRASIEAPLAPDSASAAAVTAQDSVATPPAVPDPSAEARTGVATPTRRSPWAARAEDPWERVSFTAAGLVAAVDSGVRVGPSGVGISVDLEDLLGMSTGVAVYTLGGSWRFTENKRHRADLSWMAIRRSADKTLGQDLDLGDGNILPTGTQISSRLNLNLVRATYSYSFLQDDRVDLAATAGVYIMPIDFGLDAGGFANFEESFKITAPLPLFGMRADFVLTPRWRLRNSLSLFYLEVGDYAGGMRELRSSVEWRATPWLGLGAGVESFGLGVKLDGSTDIPGVDFLGEIKFAYSGVVLYARGYL